MAEVSGAAGSSDEWTPERIAAERKRIIRQTWVILAVLVVLFFGLMDSRYLPVQGASGRTYRVETAGRRLGTGWSGSYVMYLSTAKDLNGIDREFADLSPWISELATRNGDDRIEVVAARRRFRYGSFHMDTRVATRYHRVGGEWRPG